VPLQRLESHDTRLMSEVTAGVGRGRRRRGERSSSGRAAARPVSLPIDALLRDCDERPARRRFDPQLDDSRAPVPGGPPWVLPPATRSLRGSGSRRPGRQEIGPERRPRHGPLGAKPNGVFEALYQLVDACRRDGAEAVLTPTRTTASVSLTVGVAAAYAGCDAPMPRFRACSDRRTSSSLGRYGSTGANLRLTHGPSSGGSRSTVRSGCDHRPGPALRRRSAVGTSSSTSAAIEAATGSRERPHSPAVSWSERATRSDRKAQDPCRKAVEGEEACFHQEWAELRRRVGLTRAAGN
jgi:hypothetical protein